MSFTHRLRERLSEAAEKGELTVIHVDKASPESFIVGTAKSINDKGFVFHMVGTAGEGDGFQPTLWSDVFAFQAESEYLARVAALQASPTPNESGSPDIPSDPREALKYAKENGRVVSVRDDNEAYQGFVRDIGDEWVELSFVLETSQIDGHILLDLERLDRIRIAGRDERELEHLHHLRYGGS